jgi:predicted aspartyl protease
MRWSSKITLADKRQVDSPVGAAYLGIEDRAGIILVTQLDVPVPLLGVMALETLGFKVDPIERNLERSRPFGPAAL